MAKVLYTAEAHVTGGRDEGHGRTSDGVLEVDIRVPAELGGEEGAGTNPEQLFAVGYASCFESAIKVVGKRMKQDVGDAENAAEVVRNAHAVCPYSNATRGNIDVNLTVNGDEVGGSSEDGAAGDDDD
jgi:organic hydroperoxide reductase OsmC/OhrA